MLAAPERAVAGLHVHHAEAHLLLCIFAKEGRT